MSNYKLLYKMRDGYEIARRILQMDVVILIDGNKIEISGGKDSKELHQILQDEALLVFKDAGKGSMSAADMIISQGEEVSRKELILGAIIYTAFKNGTAKNAKIEDFLSDNAIDALHDIYLNNIGISLVNQAKNFIARLGIPIGRGKDS